jgi:tetratricopeptide (TPR) repeat protein
MKLAPILSAGLALFAAACGIGFDGTTEKGDAYEAALRQANEARKTGNIDAALPLYGRALQAKPDGLEAKLGLGQSYLALGLRRDDAVALRGLAAALISMGQPAMAERQLEVVLRSDAKDFRALNAMGVALDMQGRHAEAQARYRQGIELAPEYLALRSNIGLSFAISGQVQEAIAQLTPIATAQGADGRVRQNLAFALAMAGDLEKSLEMSRRDLDEASAQRQLSYFIRLRELPPETRSVEIRRNPYFFPQSSRSA